MGIRKTFSEINYFFDHYLTKGVKWLLYINSIVFFLQAILYPINRDLFPTLFSVSVAYTIKHFFIWQIITYMFLHLSGAHFIFNMLVLWMFGIQLEKYWGTRAFVKYYLITGIGAAIFHLIVSVILAKPDSYMLGASGSLYAVLLAFAYYYPDTYLLFNFVMPIKAKYYIIIVGLLAFFSSLETGGSGIAHLTHLGGLLTGFIYLKNLRFFNKL